MAKQRLCPPPKNFKPAEDIVRAELSTYPPPFIRPTRRKGKRAEGIRYEHKVHEHFCSMYPLLYVEAPWFRYWSRNDTKWTWCRPDGFFLDIPRGVVTITEVKLKHTSDAWWQVRRVYEPVLKAYLGTGWQFAALEVVKWFDPDVAFPEPIRRVPDPASLDPSGGFGVHIWTGRQRKRELSSRATS